MITETNEYPELTKAIHKRLSDLEVNEVSLVKRAANNKKFLIIKAEDLPDEEEVDKDFGASSLATQTRFGSGGHFTPSGNSPPTKASKKEQAYIKALRQAQKLVREGRYPTVEQAFTHLLNTDSEFRLLIQKDYYGWDESEVSDDGIDPLSIMEKDYDEPVDVAIEKALSEFSDELSYEEKLEALFDDDPELELRWFYQR